MISTCLQFLLVSMVMAAGIASESPEAGSKTHANLRYVSAEALAPSRETCLPYYLTHTTTVLSQALCVCILSLPALPLYGLDLPPPS